MKLYYWKPSKGQGNFGDNLNLWLWERLLPHVLDEDETVAFIGIGTLINDLLPHYTPIARKRVIFSTGVGYGNGKAPIIDDSYKIYCLRGPLSAQKLELPPELAVTDGAVLVRRIFNPTSKKLYKYSYMPHHQLASEAWKTLCEKLEFGYVDPTWPTEKVLNAIGQTEVLLTEAMHGAIVADALRVHWIPIISDSATILNSKWKDWCLSVGLEYEPKKIKRLILRTSDKKDILSSARKVKHSIQNLWQNQSVSLQFRNIIKQSNPYLSSDSKIEELTNELEIRLDRFKQDYKSGMFNE